MRRQTTDQQILDWLVILLKVLLVLAGLVFVGLHLADSARWYKLPSYLATIVIAFVPEFLAKCGIRISRKLHLAYLLFLLPAMVVGIDLDLYKVLDGYDKVVHFTSGVLAAVVALELLNNVYEGKVVVGKRVRDRRFMFLVMISFVALSATGWECYEFFYDEIFGGTMQELIHPGVADTMWDIVAALAGGLTTGFGWLGYNGKANDKRKSLKK